MADIAETEENKGHGGFWLGMVLGGVIGGLMAYLAVDDKSKLRKELIKKGKVVLDNLEDFKDEAVEKGEEIKEDIAEKIDDAREDVPQAAQEAVENVQKAANQAIAKIVNVADRAENNVHKNARFFFKKGRSLAKK